MTFRVWSGGQTGVDQAALRAARSCGLETGGWAALGWMVETSDGKRHAAAPWLRDYGLAECPQPGYAARRRANVRDADQILLIGNPFSAGSRGLINDCKELEKPEPFAVVKNLTTARDVVVWLRGAGPGTLLVAGNRESANHGIGARTEQFLKQVFMKFTSRK